MRRRLGTAALCWAILGHPLALASPLDETSSHVMPFSGPSSEGSAMIVTNPAGLMRLPWGWYVELEGSAQLEQYDVNRTLVDPLDQSVQRRVTSATPLSLGTSIAFILASRRVSVAFRGPHLAAAERPPDADTTAPFARDGAFQRISWFGGAVSLAPLSRLLIGVLVELTQTRVRLRFGQDTALSQARDPERGLDGGCGDARCGLENPLAMNEIAIEARSKEVNWAFTLGGQLRLGDTSWAGISYRIPPGGFSSPVSMSGAAEVKSAPRDGVVTTNAKARVRLYLPHWLTLSYRQDLGERWRGSADVRWTYYQGAGNYDIRLYGNGFREQEGWINQPTNYRNTIRVTAGLEQLDLGQRVVVGGRLSLDSGANDQEDLAPTHIEGPSATLSAGIRIKVSPYVALDLGYGVQGYLPATVQTSHFDPADAVACQDSGYDYTAAACQRWRDGYAVASGRGEYQRLTHMLRANLRVTLR